MLAPAPLEPRGWDCHVHIFESAAPAQPGHYQPADRPLAQIEAQAHAHGVGHLVLVQPSVYGTDNGLILRALAQEPGRHRGVVVVDEGVSDATLHHMHALGVRGVRFNLVSPVGEGGVATASARFTQLSPQLRALGWHAQWYANAADLPRIAQLHARSGVVCVLDHLASLGVHHMLDNAAWNAAADLAAQGAWIKLSGWYRLGAQAPYAELAPHIHKAMGLFKKRVVWGSDWPHTLFEDGKGPTYRSVWGPLVLAVGSASAIDLRARLPAIYQ